MSKIETQLEINGVTYSGKDLDLICLGMSLKEESIIKLLEDAIGHDWKDSEPCEACDQTDYLIALIKGEK
jgi:hypothetical protein